MDRRDSYRWTCRRRLSAVLAAVVAANVATGSAHAAEGAIAERGVYLNIPSPLDPITVHDWNDARWAWYLDALAATHVNRLYFYLWQNEMSDFASPPESRLRNRRLHERMRGVIPEAQRRGIKVVFLFTPTFIPRTLSDERPDLRADIEYVKQGFPCICPSKEASWPVMRQVYRHELEWFKTADGFQLWFYDPGGCMCEACRRDLCAPLVRQVDRFGRLAREKNPQAEIQVSMWPIWVWEAQLNRRYGLELLDRLRARMPNKFDRLTIVDSAEVPGSFLDAARQRGFRTQAFLFSADIETPFVFLNPQYGYLRDTAARMAAKQVDGAFLHSLNPGSKSLNTLIGALALWNPQMPDDELVRTASLRYTGDEIAARRLAPCLRQWEALLLDGNPRPAAAAELCRKVEQALAEVPPETRDRVEPIAASARAIAVLVEAAAAQGNAARQKDLAAKFRKTLEASPAFRAFAAQGVAEFPRLVKWVASGWKSERF
jgi:hypothetical protein